MEFLFWALALLGCWYLFRILWDWLVPKPVPAVASLLFIVQDNEEAVEGLFRRLALDWHWKRSGLAAEVVVIDLGSRDRTEAILGRLARELGYFSLRQLPECEMGAVIRSFKQGALLMDLRVVPPEQALIQVRRFLRVEPGVFA